jgi:predicted RNase H-like HicB family nuclease
MVIASLDGDDFGRTAKMYAKGTECEDSVMAECHRYPLRVEQSKLDGWWFIFVDEMPGLGVWGRNYEDLLDRLKTAAGNLFHARGETVTDIRIIPSERPALQVFH